MKKTSTYSLSPDFRGQTILVVDDDPGNLGTIDGFLKEHCFEVLVASDGELALTRAEYVRPDLILLDVVLPGIDGFETCRRLKTHDVTKEIPVIFLTALTDTESKVKGFEAGGIDYITKPIQREELLARVAAHLHIRGLARDLQRANEDLERRIEERTAELVQTNQALRQEIIDHRRAKEALKEYSERLESMVAERTQELQAAYDTLIRQERLAVLGQLAGNVAHELRHPLGVLSNAVYFLNMTLTDADETTKDYLTLMTEEIQKADTIISELLDFSRIYPMHEVTKEACDVSTLISQVLSDHPAPDQIARVCALDDTLPSISGNAKHIRYVLTHLLQNAYQAMPDGGEVTISARCKENTVMISVSDTGCGIAPDNVEKVFEPLFTTKPKGIGLGLAVSKNLVEANSGAISVESQEQVGTRFTVTFPI